MLLPQTGRCSGAEAVLAAVRGGGSVADVLGAVTGIESTAVIDGTSLSGTMSQDRLAFSSAHQGARRSRRTRSSALFQAWSEMISPLGSNH